MEKKDGLIIKRYFTKKTGNIYSDTHFMINYEPRDVIIKDDSGKEIEKIPDAVFPKSWGQIAANTVATKYFRREGVQIGRASCRERV